VRERREDRPATAEERERIAQIVRADAAQRVLVHALERAGWTLLSAEIDTHNATARIEIKGANGRLVTLDARNGRATITRETLAVETVRTGRRGDSYRAERLRTEFIGRTRCEGLRTAMRSLAYYLADNAPAAALPRTESKRLLAPLLTGWPS
jgi:hypothetical protein